MDNNSQSRAQATWAQARHELGGTITALEFGDTVSGVVTGVPSKPARVIRLQLGVGALARKYFHAPRPGEIAVEAAIAEVEEAIMPLRLLVPANARCVTGDRCVARIAVVLGVMPSSWVTLTTDAVEDAFNRWVSIALGRPATQDALPTNAEFAASLLMLREWLHHLSFAGILLAPTNTGSSAFAS